MPVSNDYGRALEFIIAKRIIDSLPAKQIQITPVASLVQRRDEERIGELPKELIKQYEQYALIIFDWLEQEYKISEKTVILDRLSDQAAVRGDVTDIRLTIAGQDVNLSIKHNHTALKHQRPPTVAIRCGYSKDSKEDKEYRLKYNKIIADFLNGVNTKFPKAEAFNQIKSQQSDYIDKNMYRPICILVADTINKLCSDKPEKTKSLFNFLVGNTDFYKLRTSGDSVELQEFAKIVSPSNVMASVGKNGYVNLNFSNEWNISMRLHTATTLIGSSVKFDTQLINEPVPVKVLTIK